MSEPRWWRYVRVVLLILAILSHVWLTASLGIINEDETFSMGEAISFTQGKGFTLSPVIAPNPGNIQYLHTLKFPIGLSLFYAALLKMSFSPGLADFTLDIISIVLFFVFWFIILESLQKHISVWARLFLWCFWIIFPAPLMAGAMDGHTADTLAVAFFSGNIAFLVLGLKDTRRILLYSGIGGALMGIAAMLKYVYWPALAIGPLALAGLALYHCSNWRKIFLAAIINTAVGALFLTGMMIESRIVTGHLSGYALTLTGKVTPRMVPSPTLHWEQVLRATPSPAYSLGLTPFSFYSLRNLKLVPLALTGDRYVWLYTGFILAVFFLVSIWVLSKTRISAKSSDDILTGFVFITGAITIIWIIGWQIWLSIAYEASEYIGGWVPLMDIRYNSPIFAFLTLGMAQAIFAPLSIKRRWLGLGLCLFFAASMLYPAYISLRSRANIIEKEVSFGLRLRAEKTYYSRTEELKGVIDQLPQNGYPVVVMYPDNEKDYYEIRQSVFLLGVPGLILPDESISTSKPLNIVLLYQHNLQPEQQQFFDRMTNKYNSTCSGLNNFIYCTFVVRPDGMP